MCEPTTWLAVGMAFTAIAGGVEANAQRQAGKANAQIAENNATLAKQQGRDAQLLSVRQQQEAAWRTRALIGKQKTQAAASGLDMDVGTPLDIMGETAAFGQAEEDAIGLDAARKAWGYDGEALNYRNQGAQAMWMGKQQSNATILKTIGSMANMGASAYGNMAKAPAGQYTLAKETMNPYRLSVTGTNVGINPYITRGWGR